MSFDLLSTVEYGGCSAKLSPTELQKILDQLPRVSDERILVDVDTCDDAGVYKLTDDEAIIFTTDFFPPVCSDPYTFGQIAAANALSDVYAMGGEALLALNIMMFSTTKIPIDAYTAILKGGFDKVKEAGAFTIGGHTIDDHPPKYGLAVVGRVHPEKVITNANAKSGDILILTKPLGIGALIAGWKNKLASEKAYQKALEQMMLLNRKGAQIMQKHSVRAATDITGFGLAGHCRNMAAASNVSMRFDIEAIPFLEEAEYIYKSGCIPGATFRNREYSEKDVEFIGNSSYYKKLLCFDAQTSGGLLICAPSGSYKAILGDLKNSGIYPYTSVIGEVLPKGRKYLYLKA